MCLARQARVERLEAAGRAEQQPGRDATVALVQGDLPAQVLYFGGPQPVRRAGLDCHQELKCGVQRAGIVLGLGSRKQPLGPVAGFACQQRRPLQERRSRGYAPRACARRAGAPARPRHPRPDLGRPEPGARPAGRDRPAGRSPLLAPDAPPACPEARPTGRPACAPADGGTAPGGRTRPAGLSGRRRCPGTDPEPLGSSPHQHWVANRIGCRHLDQAPGPGRKSVKLPADALLDPSGQRYRPGQPEPARQLSRRQPSRQFQQRQRVTSRLGDDLVPDPPVDRPGQRGVQQHPRVTVPQPLDHQLRQPGQVAARDPGREDQAN